MKAEYPIHAERSGRHIHLSPAHFAALFGPGVEPHIFKPLSQEGIFAAVETVTLEYTNGRQLKKVRVLGPLRPYTQIEISTTDAYNLGMDPLPPIRLSGNLAGSPGIKVIGPCGQIILETGVIIAQRHLHVGPEEAAHYHLKNNDVVAIRIASPRGGTLENVVVRVADKPCCAFHLDSDEANAMGIVTGTIVELIRRE